MRVTVHLADGGVLDVEDMDDGSALDMRKDLEDGESRFLALDMDGATVLFARSQIVRVDMETGE